MNLAGDKILVGPGFSTVLPDMDFESYSAAGYYWDGPANRWRGADPNGKGGLPVVGASVYCEHPSTEIISLAYDLKDGLGARLWLPHMVSPVELFNHIAQGGLLEAWNSAFEYQLWLRVCEARMGWPALPLEQLRCAASKSRAWSLPGALKNAGKVLEAPEQKDKAGDLLIRKLCIPRSPTKNDKRLRRTPADSPEDFKAFYKYNVQDIKSEAALSRMTPDLQPQELALWLIDQQINQRGVHIDVQALEACISIVEQARAKYTPELQRLTDHFVMSADEIQKMGDWLRYRGVAVGTIDADSVEALLKQPDLPVDCRRVLEIRASLGARSVAKLLSIQRRISFDDRLRELFAFCGADRTGRFAGRGPQPQNLPNSGPEVVRCSYCSQIHAKSIIICPNCQTLQGPDDSIEWGIEAVEAALAAIMTRNLDTVEAYFGDAIAAVAGCLRGLFSAEPGKELVCSDYNSIEAVVLAALAGEEWRLEVFRTHGRLYEMSASAVTGIPFEEFMVHAGYTLEQLAAPNWWEQKPINKGEHHPMRKKIGKVNELANGYSGWIGASKQFGADKYFNDKEIKENILTWRDASPMIVEFWGGQWRKDPNRWHFEPELYGVEGAVVQAIQNPGERYRYRELLFGVKDDVLYIRLPSGRFLNYHKPRLSPDVAPHGNPILAISYEGWNSDYKKGPKGWMRLGTYGGKFAENITQAVARDIMTNCFPKLEAAGYPIVLHVHDEPVSEVPTGYGSVEEYEDIMMDLPEWCRDWPIKASGGWRGQRYRK